MNFKQYLRERLGSSHRKLIVVDIQPLYEEGIKRRISLEDFAKFFFNMKNDILYFYNGPETIASDDSPEEIMDWLSKYYVETNESVNLKEYEEDDVLTVDRIDFDWDKVSFVDKGYSFFRDWMDAGVSNNGMIKALRYMYTNRVYDSRDIPAWQWQRILPENDFEAIKDWIEDEGLTIWTPDISIGELKDNWNGSLLCGGGINQCLKEIQLLLNAFNIKYKMVDQFIY